MKPVYSISVFLLTACCFIQTLSATPIPTIGSQAFLKPLPYIGALPTPEPFKLNPVATVSAFGGTNISGEAQGLYPFLGDMSHIFFAEAETHITDDNSHKGWMLGGGLGYRQVVGNNILGGYFITNYNVSPEENHFWTGNVGVEALGKVWDFRANIYTPLDTHKKEWVIDKGWAEQDFNIDDYFWIDGHTITDHLISRIEEIGSGVDAEVGRTIPWVKGLKAHVGGYYFHYHFAEDVKGIETRVTYEFNRMLSLEAVDAYDTYHHNTAVIGLKIALGGFTQDERNRFGIASRLLDPIEHNFAAIPNGTNTDVMIVNKDEGEQTVTDNAWFFKEPEDRNDFHQNAGTIDDPIIGVNQGMIDYINANPAGIKDPFLFFANRTENGEIKSYYLNDNNVQPWIAIPDNFQLYGRDEGFLHDVFGDDRPIFIGSIDLGDKNRLASMQLQNDPMFPNTLGLRIQRPYSVSDIDIINVKVGTGNQDATDYDDSSFGIYSSADNINVRDSQFYVYGNFPGLTQNIAIYGSFPPTTFTFSNNTFNANNPSGSAANIFATGNVSLTLTNNTFDANAPTISYGISKNSPGLDLTAINNTFNIESGGYAYGIFSNGNSTINIDTITMNVMGGLGAYGIYLGGSGTNGSLTIDNTLTSENLFNISSISATTVAGINLTTGAASDNFSLSNSRFIINNGGKNAFGVYMPGSASANPVTLTNNTFEISANENGCGICMAAANQLIINNLALNVTGNDDVYGIHLAGSGVDGSFAADNITTTGAGIKTMNGNAYGIYYDTEGPDSFSLMNSNFTVDGALEAYGIKVPDLNGNDMLFNRSTFDVSGGTDAYGIDVNNVGDITLLDSNLTVDNKTDSGETIGINISGTGTGTLSIRNNSSVNVGTLLDGGDNAYGIKVSKYAFDNSEINTSTIDVKNDSGNAYGIEAPASKAMTITNATINVSVNPNNFASTTARGINMVEPAVFYPAGTLTIKDSTFNISGAETTYGVYTPSSVIMDLDGASINSTAYFAGANYTNTFAYGIYVVNTADPLKHKAKFTQVIHSNFDIRLQDVAVAYNPSGPEMDHAYGVFSQSSYDSPTYKSATQIINGIGNNWNDLWDSPERRVV